MPDLLLGTLPKPLEQLKIKPNKFVTLDIDLVADLQESQIELLLNTFSPRFDRSERAIRDAIE